MKKKIALALSAALFFTLVGSGYAYAKTPVAYVSVDINPSVELGVNAFDTVVSVEAYNEDGSNILEGTDLLNTKVDEAVSTVVTNAINDGYIKEDGSSAIEITTSTDKTEVAAELDETLKEVVDETLTNNDVEAEVQTENVALARRDEARTLGITPGKLNLIQKLQALDPSITVEEYKNSSVKDIQKKTKELRKNGIIETTAQDGTSTTTTTETAGTTTTTSDTAATNNTTTEATISNEPATNEAAVVETKNNKASNEKINNGNSKKEETTVNQEQISQPAVDKQNKNENSSAQSSNNSSKEDKSSNIKTDNNSESSSSISKSDNNSSNSSQKSENSNKGNSSKSDSNGSSSSSSSNSGNGASSSQGKGKSK